MQAAPVVDQVAQLAPHVANMTNRDVVAFFDELVEKSADYREWSFVRQEQSWWRFNLYGNTTTYSRIVELLQKRAVEFGQDQFAAADWEKIRHVPASRIFGVRDALRPDALRHYLLHERD